MDELLDPIRQAADQVGESLLLELLGWHRAIVGLPDFDSTIRGASPAAIAELGVDRPPICCEISAEPPATPADTATEQTANPAIVPGRRSSRVIAAASAPGGLDSCRGCRTGNFPRKQTFAATMASRSWRDVSTRRDRDLGIPPL